MSSKDQVEADWTSYFTRRFGFGMSRRNAEIYVPIVMNFTIPTIRYNDGTVHPPEPATKNYKHVHAAVEPLINEDIPLISFAQAMIGLDTNPNYKGDGKYFPEYHKNGLLYDYPEWDPKIRESKAKPRREFPLEIRRRMYF